MRRSVCAAALFAVVGCGSDSIPARPPPAPVDWSLTSTDGRFQVRQSRDAAGCRVEAVVLPDRRLWSSRSCVPPGALAFLSPDGRRLLVLDAFPPGQGGDLGGASLVSLWADGAVLREYRGAEVLGTAAPAAGGLSWLRGATAEAVRAAARASPEGSTVQLELADGRTLGLGFDGAPLPAPPREGRTSGGSAGASLAAPGAASAPEPRRPGRSPSERQAQPPRAGDAAMDALGFDEVGLYRWEDESGSLHFGSGSQVPPRYRRRAVRVSTSVGVMPTDRAPAPGPSSAPASAAPTQAGAPASGAPAAGTPAAGAPAAGAPGGERPPVKPEQQQPPPG